MKDLQEALIEIVTVIQQRQNRPIAPMYPQIVNGFTTLAAAMGTVKRGGPHTMHLLLSACRALQDLWMPLKLHSLLKSPM